MLSYWLLVITISLEHWFFNPPAVDSAFLIWLIRTSPVLMLAPGILCKWPRWFARICFVVLFYFTSAVVGALPENDLSSWIKTLLCVTLFISSMFYVRSGTPMETEQIHAAITPMTEDDVMTMEVLINTMPRKVLGGWTPLEVYTGQPIALIA
ncbi:MAG: DUF2069 domain-containing protein [Candidatus Endonucleobacter sp. (ex Gigantidas childressi)]|nr:DUF2069 domain-containing protein [Candidatus Endonucleobacter sp. (ex Gigantidas childressi)]